MFALRFKKSFGLCVGSLCVFYIPEFLNPFLTPAPLTDFVALLQQLTLGPRVDQMLLVNMDRAIPG